MVKCVCVYIFLAATTIDDTQRLSVDLMTLILHRWTSQDYDNDDVGWVTFIATDLPFNNFR